MANKELREWRKKVHAYIDPQWKQGKMSRGTMYSIISKHIGKQFHTGESNIDMCKKVLSIKF